MKWLSYRVSYRVAFTQGESFKNYSPQSGTVILKLFSFSDNIKSLLGITHIENLTLSALSDNIENLSGITYIENLNLLGITHTENLTLSALYDN